MGIFSALGGATLAQPAPKLSKPQIIVIGVFWTVYLVLAAGIALEDAGPAMLPLSPVLIPVIWGGIHLWQGDIRAFLANSAIPGWVLFGILGLLLSTITIGATIGFGVRERAASDIPAAASTLVFIGPWAGLLAATWLARRRWKFRSYHAFWTLGALGALTEQGGAMPTALLEGDIVGGLLLAVYLVPAYGVGVAATLGVMPERKLPEAKRAPTVGAFAALIALMWIGFAIFSALWVVILRGIF
ncbi:MAG: hypothetical protein HOQ05_08175 [Corynebacteriales bacterium]|nr:hypothetical protein [Mycobacteriales bacterium]